MFTTSAIFTCATAPADAFAAAPSSGAACRDCRTTPSRARRVHRPQNRADVVRIFDAVEHDDERGARARRDEILDARRSRASRTSATTP